MIVPFSNLRLPLNIAHRGSMVLAPENTARAFHLALELGADVLETDVRLSADGHVVVFHDRDVSRTRFGEGPVRGFSLAELQNLAPRAPMHVYTPDSSTVPKDLHSEIPEELRIPTLDGILSKFHDQYFSIDIKDDEPEAARRTIEVIRSHDAAGRVILASFHVGISKMLRAQAPEMAIPADKNRCIRALATGGMFGYPAGSFFMLPAYFPGRTPAVNPQHAHREDEPLAGEASVPDSRPPARLLEGRPRRFLPGRRFINTVHRRGGRVFVWTVDDPEDMQQLLASGIDGIVTNRPDLLSRLIRS